MRVREAARSRCRVSLHCIAGLCTCDLVLGCGRIMCCGVNNPTSTTLHPNYDTHHTTFTAALYSSASVRLCAVPCGVRYTAVSSQRWPTAHTRHGTGAASYAAFSSLQRPSRLKSCSNHVSQTVSPSSHDDTCLVRDHTHSHARYTHSSNPQPPCQQAEDREQREERQGQGRGREWLLS